MRLKTRAYGIDIEVYVTCVQANPILEWKNLRTLVVPNWIHNIHNSGAGVSLHVTVGSKEVGSYVSGVSPSCTVLDKFFHKGKPILGGLRRRINFCYESVCAIQNLV